METDEEVEEIVEKEVVKDVVQEIKVPQVKALHPFSGQGLKMAKGEVSRVDMGFGRNPSLTGILVW